MCAFPQPLQRDDPHADADADVVPVQDAAAARHLDVPAQPPHLEKVGRLAQVRHQVRC